MFMWLITISSEKTSVNVKVRAKRKKESAEKFAVVPLDSPAMGTRSAQEAKDGSACDWAVYHGYFGRCLLLEAR